ncbi:hypothetical protein DRQ11_02980 [candidate division KSB1 bacterium]|nr:MAG: hypothetical protein DRQ11_02980 [candidate division KSB1 bacterium]
MDIEAQPRRQSRSVFELIDHRVLFAALVLLIFVGYFLSNVFTGAWGFIIKVTLFVLVVWLVYRLFLDISTEKNNTEIDRPEEKQSVYPKETTADIDSPSPGETLNLDLFSPEEKHNFYQELETFFRNLIATVRSTFVAFSAVIFLWDRAQQVLRVEFCDTQSQSLKKGNIVEIEGTLPGQVFKNKMPLLEQNIPSEAQLAHYYDSSETIKSFLGVPISVKGELIGVLTVDSKVAEDFSPEDIELLNSYEKLIGQGILILSTQEKSRLINSFLRAQRLLLSQFDQEDSLENIIEALGNACKVTFEFHRLTISMVNSDQHDTAKIVKVLGQKDEMPEGFQFNLFEGLTGWVIRKSKPLLLDDLEKGDLFRPRYVATESSNFELRSFLGVPIHYQTRTFGAVTIECRQPEFYSEWDQYILLLLANNTGLALNNMLNKPIQSQNGLEAKGKM